MQSATAFHKLMDYPASMASSKTVLCAISHGLYEPWISILLEGQEKTWLKDPRPDNFKVLHFHGTPLNKFGRQLDVLHERIRWSTRRKAQILKFLDFLFTWPLKRYEARYSVSDKLNVSDVAIHIHFPDTYLTYRWKELALFRYFLEQTNHRYLFITSSSSYVRIPLLMKFVEELPSEGVYVGAIPYESAEFISGANRILSRDVVQKIVDHSLWFNPTVIEDVALGNIVEKLGFNRTGFPISNIGSMTELENSSDKYLNSSYHFRLKSGSLDDRGDVEIMHKLHARIRKVESL